MTKIENYTKKLKRMFIIFLAIIVISTIVTNTALSAQPSETKGTNIANASIIDITTYYRGLGHDPNAVETSDLLKAADDWRNSVVPPGFSISIITNQLLALADEWRTGISVPTPTLTTITCPSYIMACDNNTIISLAESHYIANNWWQFSRGDRWNVSSVLIDTFQKTRRYIDPYYEVDNNGNTTQYKGWCLNNAVIRYATFNGSNVDKNISRCSYFDRNNIKNSFYNAKSYGLPVYFTNLDNPWHSIDALQIGENISDFNSWRFFQYDNDNIQVGDWQMMNNVDITIVDGYYYDCAAVYGTDRPIAIFHR